MAGLISEVWNSFRAVPLWVQIWVAALLAPVNMAAIFFLDAPGGWLVAVLAIGGMVPNVVLIVVERGLSKAMSISHLLLWIPLVGFLWFWLLGDPAVQGAFRTFVWVLLAVDLVSLGFDVMDSAKWLRGDRGVAKRVDQVMGR